VLADRAGVDEAELAQLRGGAGAMIPEPCARLVAEGKVIEAIKVYRERTGAGLKEAKDAVDRYREGRG
jgi:large subunit ribosomal protein L7/L12